MTELADRNGLAALLAWYRDMGVDSAVGEEAENWLERPDRPPGAGFRLDSALSEERPTAGASRPVAQAAPHAAPSQSAPAVARAGSATASASPPSRPSLLPPSSPPRAVAAAPPPPDAAETAARTAARGAKTLEELGAALAAFNGCALQSTAKNLCFYRGAPQARVMIIGEAPGREEDLAGKPFVGPAGQLLDKMLAAIGLDESSAHITNIVYWRPPGNRTPTPQEAATCRAFLERQAELVAPDIVLALGGAAAKHILDVTEGIMRVRGKWSEVTLGSHRARAMATLHPAFLLRTPSAKRDAWRDLLAVKTALTG